MVFAPAALPLLIDGVAVSAFDIARTLVLNVSLPLLAGLIFRARFANAAQRLAPIMSRVSSVIGVSVLVLLAIAYSDRLISLREPRTLAALVLFLGLAIAIGWLTGGPERSGRRVLAIACGQSNQAAAFLLATHNFTDPRIPAIVVGILLISVGMLVSPQFAGRALACFRRSAEKRVGDGETGMVPSGATRTDNARSAPGEPFQASRDAEGEVHRQEGLA
jgi:BASS family bile acid:Na+ symporter